MLTFYIHLENEHGALTGIQTSFWQRVMWRKIDLRAAKAVPVL